MKKYQWKLIICIMIILMMGYLIPMDFKVMFGFIGGICTGGYILPEYIRERIIEEQGIHKL